MASRKYLNLSFNYVPNWDYTHAIRELFQNSLDSETKDSNNKMYFEYNKEEEVLSIGNKNGILEERSLLLGASSKRDDAKQIGQHGEGYKIATVVLLREGLGLKIFNQNKKQVWVAKKVKSRSYDEEIPVFDIEHQIFKKGADLVFEVSGVTEEMFEKIIDSNLHLIERYRGGLGNHYESEDGKVLLDEQFRHKVFVKGLYVCDNEAIDYGYDFSPELVKLDRDRHLIDSFNIMWNSSRLIARMMDSDLIRKCINKNDGKYLDSFVYMLSDKIKNDVAYDFFKEYGSDAVPCNTRDEFNDVAKSGHNAVLVNDSVATFVKTSDYYKESGIKIEPLSEKLSNWFERLKEEVGVDEHADIIKEGEDLIKLVSSHL